MPTTKADPARLTLTVTEAAAVLGISRGSAYEAVRTGAIPSLRVGRRILVPTAPLRRLLGAEAGNPAASGAPPEQVSP